MNSEEKHKFNQVARDSHDALEIVNAFYNHPFDVSESVFEEFWQQKVCILAERVVAAEKALQKAKTQ